MRILNRIHTKIVNSWLFFHLYYKHTADFKQLKKECQINALKHKRDFLLKLRDDYRRARENARKQI